MVGDARVLLGEDATETAFKTNAKGFQYLHIASHGRFDSDSPIKSALLLTGDEDNDGELTVDEIYDLEIHADLVTLSACETGLGDITSGDDVVGLSRAFLYAGTKRIVSSLWKVDDTATSRLMQEFYGKLRTENASDALQDAKLKINRDYNRQPYYWAAFQLTGAK